MKVLICETDRIGDLILTLPVIKSVKMANPINSVGVLISSYTSDLLKNNPYISRVFTYSGCDKKLADEIRQENYDAALILFPKFDIARLIFLSGIKKRIGLGFKWYQFLYTKTVIQHRSRIKKHQAEYNLDFLAEIGIHKFYKDLEIFLSQNDISFADDFLKSNSLGGYNIICVHPSSGYSSLNVSTKFLLLVMSDLSKRYNAKFIITNSARDKRDLEMLTSRLKSDFVITPDNLDIMQLAAVISKCKLFISNSTGPLHIASALKVPTISFYSPVFVHSPKRWGPYQHRNLILVPDVKCPANFKCKGESCENYNCMDFSHDPEKINQIIDDFVKPIFVNN
ncbi:MAG: glycosyltransferase family 9 protein [Elusimicrobia bacterium]|nr:glycosyltransferase family 9 protein [Elusimicrobiota bacterium]